MDKHRRKHLQFTRVAELQSLRAMASEAECAAAIAEARRAETHLSQCRDAATQEAERLEALMEARALDFDAWRIGRAALGHLDDLHEAAAQDSESLSRREAAQRDSWHRERRLSDLAAGRCRKLARKVANARDEKAASEAVSLPRPPVGGSR